MRLYYVRHGQTDANVQKREAGGLTEIDLNAVGVQQAEETRRLLANIDFDMAICSPLRRARQTLEIINRGREIPEIVDERLRERKLGEVEGKILTAEENQRIWSFAENCEIPGDSETVVDFAQRIVNFFEQLPKEQAGKNVLVVAHGRVGQVLKSFLAGKAGIGNLNDFLIDNCEVVEVEL